MLTGFATFLIGCLACLLTALAIAHDVGTRRDHAAILAALRATCPVVEVVQGVAPRGVTLLVVRLGGELS